jgi:DNA gyrase/topoisomerase IV subunit A
MSALLPDAFDGLTPLAREILRRLPRPGAPYKKTSRMLWPDGPARSLDPLLRAGGTAWREAPDPDVTAYATLVDLGTPWTSNVPLVDYRGNWGSYRGEAPADSLYTECRLTRWGAAVLAKQAPNLLINGFPGRFLPHDAHDTLAALRERVAGGSAREPSWRLPGGGDVLGGIGMRGRTQLGDGELLITALPWRCWLDDFICELDMMRGVVAEVRDLTDLDGTRLVVVPASGVTVQRLLETILAQTTFQVSAIDPRATDGGVVRAFSPTELVELAAPVVEEWGTSALVAALP